MNIAFKEYNEIIGMIESSYHKAARKMGLPDSEMGILYVLSSYPQGCNQSTIYHEAGLTKSTANSALKKMEKSGILCITPAVGRNTWVSATEKGKALMEQTVRHVIEMENEIYASWSESEQDLFLQLNRNFAEKLAERVEKLSPLPSELKLPD